MKNRPFVLVAFPLLMITQAVFAQTTCVSRHNQPDGSGGFITGFDCSFYQQNVYPFDLTGYITNGGASLSENALTPGYVIWTSDGTITGTWMDVLDFDANILAGTGSSRVYLFWPGGPSFPSLAGDYLVLPWNPSGVELFDPGDGNHTFTVYDNASTPVAPTISSLSPSSVPAGGPAFTLTVNGSGFLSGATVEWNGSAISSSYVSANQMSALIPANLIASQSSASVTVLNPGAGASIAVTFIVSGASGAGNVQIISHIADGGGWRSTIILVNTDSVPASYSVNFWSDLGAPYLPPLASGTTSGSIPVGGSTTIETADAASNLTEGWAEVTSSQSIGGTAIFRLDTSGQEAAVPLLTSGGAALEIPYQVGNGLALGVALANPSTTQTANITEVIRDQNGNQLSGRTLTLPALNHTAFNPTFPNGLTGSGVVEYVANVSIFALGIRADNGAFTSVDAVLPQAASTKTISHIADGGGWRSTIVLVNTDSVPASYTVNFRSDLGAPYLPPLASGTTSGNIPVGGSTTIETADAASDLTEGWAEVTSSQSIGGTAIFRLDTPGQEAAVPLLTSGGVALEIPYQVGNGLALGVALANPSTTQTANITEVIRDQNGNQLSSRTLTLPALNHTAFNPTFPNGLTGSGVVEYVANVSIFALGIRADSGAFTSVDAVYK